MDDLGSLIANRLYDPGMRMAKRIDPEPRNEIEVLVSLKIEDEDTFSFFKSDGIAIVGGKKIAFFEFDNLILAGHV